MENPRVHTFHIPVMGLAFSIDTPIRVARFGISSVISIVDDILIEHMRKHYSSLHSEPYTPISPKDDDHRARRITAYLNLVNRIVHRQVAELEASAFERGSEIVKYFEMLADRSPLKALYRRMIMVDDPISRATLENELRAKIVPGAIDVNIMTKVDKTNTGTNRKELPPEFSDALASLRGFTKSDLESSVVLSAGLNSRLFSYMGRCPEFLPDCNGTLRKKVILKVSDYRSAYIQGKILAKKGIWISEFRIESGLNCGGHAFATDGILMGPILEEFKTKKHDLLRELHELYCAALREKGIAVPLSPPKVRITVQGGIGTANEDTFLREFYEVDGTGWASPFLLVPEATNVDDETRRKLATARKEDYYLSDASPLGIPFSNLRDTSSEQQIRRRADEGKPGSPCLKKFLVSNTEFTKEPICTASRQYQSLKLKQLKRLDLASEEMDYQIGKVLEKACLCEDLAATALINSKSNGTPESHAVAICPGPNLAYFSKIATLEEMVGHIYGRVQLLTVLDRPNLFVNELRLNVEYLRNEIRKRLDSWTAKEEKHFGRFRANLQEGIAYYKLLIPKLVEETERYREAMRMQMLELEQELLEIVIPSTEVCVEE